MPTLGVEALAGHGVDLDRLLLVPTPGPRWLSVVSALSEVIPLIAIRPATSAREAELSRLSARLRDRGCTLLVVPGPGSQAWPQSEGSIRVHDPRWQGLGDGWGALEECEVTVTARTRRSPVPQSVRVRLPDVHGRIHESVEAAAPALPRLFPLPSAAAEARPVTAIDARPSAESPALLAVAG